MVVYKSTRLDSKIESNESLNKFSTKTPQPTTSLSLINSKETLQKRKEKPVHISLGTKNKFLEKDGT